MGKILVKARKKILVKARPQLQYDMKGNPSFVFGAGGGGQGGGKTKRERILGGIGGAVGVLGALTGKHRSLGGLMGSMYAGAAQGKNLGGSLGRGLTSRNRQARADLQEKERQQYSSTLAEEEASDRDPYRHVGSLSDMRFGRKGRQEAMKNWAEDAGKRDMDHKMRSKIDSMTREMNNPELQDAIWRRTYANQQRSSLARKLVADQMQGMTEQERAERARQMAGVVNIPGGPIGGEPGTFAGASPQLPMVAGLPVNGPMSTGTGLGNGQITEANSNHSGAEEGLRDELTDEQMNNMNTALFPEDSSLRGGGRQSKIWSEEWERGLNEDGAQ